jgi:hypothetical protein
MKHSRWKIKVERLEQLYSPQHQIDHQIVGQAVKVILKGFSGANEKFYNFLLENFSHPVSGKLF